MSKTYKNALILGIAIGGIVFVAAAVPGLRERLTGDSGSSADSGSPSAKLSSANCQTPDRSQVQIPAGEFLMGSESYYEDEGPVHEASVGAFSIDRFAVTNAEFATFVEATGYVTDAEKKPTPADYPEVEPDQLVAGGATFMPLKDSPSPVEMMEWWRFTPGANWRHPDGPGSSIDGKENYPVVQVSFNDALAYATWAGRELPTEEQMEYAARGGLNGKTYAWGDEFKPDGEARANTWEGKFPVTNTGDDGFDRAAPVGCFPPNGYGLYDMTGNVWEWTTSLYDKTQKDAPASRVLRVVKGGSFLCAENFCRRYRPAARQPQESGFSAVHLGFRTVKNGPR